MPNINPETRPDAVGVVIWVVKALGPEFGQFLENSGLVNDHATALTLHRVAKANGL
jgi:hypothetical protein